jgi:hypothetical protein
MSIGLNQTWLRLTGRDTWPEADGFVFSSEYVPHQHHARSHYHVVYSYKVDDERYVGQFDDFLSEQRFRVDEPITIRFNPKNPNRSYFLDQQTDTLFFVTAIFFGVVLACIVIIANLLASVKHA